MVEIRRLMAGGVVFTVGLAWAAPAHAGPIWNWICGNDCPPPDYSECRYLTPTLARGYDCVKGPHVMVVLPDGDKDALKDVGQDTSTGTPYVRAPDSISPLLVIPVAKSDEKIIVRKADTTK